MFPPAAKFINAHKGVHPGGRLCRRSAGILGFSFFQPTYVDPYFKITPGNTGPEVATEVNLKVYALRKLDGWYFQRETQFKSFPSLSFSITPSVLDIRDSLSIMSET